MPATEEPIRIYRELAECYERQGEAQMRDRFLVLAADAARTAGREDEAERLRTRLLQYNPHHLLKPYATFAEAMKSPDVQNYVAALRRNHSRESAEQLLESLRSRGPAAAKPTQPLPRPVGEGGSPARPRAEAPAEPAPVYRVKEEAEAPRSSASEVPPTLLSPKARPAPPPAPAARNSSGARPEVYRVRPEPELPPSGRGEAGDADEADALRGAWVATLLFGLVLAVGVLLAAYTGARPFLPPEWLPH